MTPTRLFISHDSALEFWRTHDLSRAGGVKRTRLTSLQGATAFPADIKRLAKRASPDAGRVYGARTDGSLRTAVTHLDIKDSPLHIMVCERKDRRKRPNLVAHYYPNPLPEGSFCEIGHNTYVASPELTLVQMATRLPQVDVLELCLEFCSGYTINPESERGFDDRPALTSRKRLQAFVDKMKGHRGAGLIKPILPFVIDDSASPMESIVLMLLCLPSRKGGYQLPLPKHNEPIPVTGRARSHTGRKHLVCDLYWEKWHLDVECDSTANHTSKEQLGIDSDRRIILDAMKYHYVGITRWQLEDSQRFLDVVQAIRRAMGFRLKNAPQHIEYNREALRRYLVTPHGERIPLRLLPSPKRRSRRRKSGL